MRDLSYPALWLTGGALLVVLVIVLSLMSSPQGVVPPSLQDKSGHLIAYFTLMTWFAGIWRRPSHWVLLLAFIALGAALEWLQGFLPLRVSDPLDMLANSAGAIVALVLARAGLDRWCVGLEQAWQRLRGSANGH